MGADTQLKSLQVALGQDYIPATTRLNSLARQFHHAAEAYVDACGRLRTIESAAGNSHTSLEAYQFAVALTLIDVTILFERLTEFESIWPYEVKSSIEKFAKVSGSDMLARVKALIALTESLDNLTAELSNTYKTEQGPNGFANWESYKRTFPQIEHNFHIAVGPTRRENVFPL